MSLVIEITQTTAVMTEPVVTLLEVEPAQAPKARPASSLPPRRSPTTRRLRP
jgi:hypothetical protein